MKSPVPEVGPLMWKTVTPDQIKKVETECPLAGRNVQAHLLRR